MQENERKHEVSLFRRIIIVTCLPLATFIWIAGWTLTMIGERVESRETVQKSLRVHHRFESHMENLEPLTRPTLKSSQISPL